MQTLLYFLVWGALLFFMMRFALVFRPLYNVFVARS